MRLFQLLCFFLLLVAVSCRTKPTRHYTVNIIKAAKTFEFPPLTIELLSRNSLNLSVPEMPGRNIEFAKFTLKFDEEFESVDDGDYQINIYEPADGFYRYQLNDLRLMNGQTIYHRLSLSQNNTIYENDVQTYKVKGLESLEDTTTVSSE